jgi:hypothetical protein
MALLQGAMTRPLIRPRPSATFSPREKENRLWGRPRPLVMVSLSVGRGCPARHAFTSARGTGEGLLSVVNQPLFPDLLNFDSRPDASSVHSTNYIYYLQLLKIK